MFRRIIRFLFPKQIYASLSNYKILSLDFGQFKTMKRGECVDANDAPIPWYSYPAIEYIKQLDVSDKSVFEYGSGNSTLFWAARCQKIVAVEDYKLWHDKIKPRLPSNAEYHLLENVEEYVKSISLQNEKFDIIIIDGSRRYDCAVEAIKKLKDDGFIILDNSDWMESASKLLREADLIEVDMSGFGAINGYTGTTSFYFRRGVNLKPAHDRQPMHGIGSLKHRDFF